MSGIASAASTMPGRVATFWSCSRERSVRMAARSSSSAKTRAGTRMSGRASAGISQTVSSIRRSSDIEDEPSLPDAVPLGELEPVVGHGLHERRRAPDPAAHRGPELCVPCLDLRFLRNEPRRLGEEDQLLQPLREQRGPVRGVEFDLVLLLRAAGGADEFAERAHRVVEHKLGGRCGHVELELGRVLNPLVGHATTSAEQPKTSAAKTSPSSTPRSEGWSSEISISPSPSSPSAAAPSSEPKQRSESTEITLRRPVARRAMPSSSRSSSNGSMRTLESEPMQIPIPRSQSRSTGQ